MPDLGLAGHELRHSAHGDLAIAPTQALISISVRSYAALRRAWGPELVQRATHGAGRVWPTRSCATACAAAQRLRVPPRRRGRVALVQSLEPLLEPGRDRLAAYAQCPACRSRRREVGPRSHLLDAVYYIVWRGDRCAGFVAGCAGWRSGTTGRWRTPKPNTALGARRLRFGLALRIAGGGVDPDSDDAMRQQPPTALAVRRERRPGVHN